MLARIYIVTGFVFVSAPCAGVQFRYVEDLDSLGLVEHSTMCQNAVDASTQISERTCRLVPVLLNKLYFLCIVVALRPGVRTFKNLHKPFHVFV